MRERELCVCVCVCVWFLISMVSQQEGLSTVCLSSAWSLNSIVFYQQHGFLSAWSFIRMVSLSLRWSFIGMVSHQDGLSSAWSFIRKVFHQEGLSSGRSFTAWSHIIMVFHHHALSSARSVIRMVFRHGFCCMFSHHHSLSSSRSFISMICHQNGLSSRVLLYVQTHTVGRTGKGGRAHFN